MKKILIAAALAFLSVEAAQAKTFGLFTYAHCNQCNPCYRPYNAFSPICSNQGSCGPVMPGGCASGACVGYDTDGAPLPAGPASQGAPKKGAYMFMPGSPTNFVPVYMNQGYPTPYQVIPQYQAVPQQ
ncbi:MAG: hypothetical protein ACO3GX_05230 [Gemmataceae bacterium]|jgi:hypothetical protein